MRSIWVAALTGVLACVVLGAAAAGAPGRWVMQQTLPAARVTFAAALPEMRLLTLDLAPAAHGRAVLRMRVDLDRPVTAGTRVVEPLSSVDPGAWMQVDLGVLALFQHGILLLGIAVAWPATRLRHRLARLLVATPLAAAACFATLVSTLVAEAWAPIHAQLVGTRDALSLDWSQYLMGGGGTVLAVATAVVVIRLVPVVPSPADPCGRAAVTKTTSV